MSNSYGLGKVRFVLYVLDQDRCCLVEIDSAKTSLQDNEMSQEVRCAAWYTVSRGSVQGSDEKLREVQGRENGCIAVPCEDRLSRYQSGYMYFQGQQSTSGLVFDERCRFRKETKGCACITTAQSVPPIRPHYIIPSDHKVSSRTYCTLDSKDRGCGRANWYNKQPVVSPDHIAQLTAMPVSGSIQNIVFAAPSQNPLMAFLPNLVSIKLRNRPGE
jgi:hypothetical protein